MIAAQLDAFLDEHGGAGQVTVAYSGGLDSSVLLQLAQAWAQRRGRSLAAIHVHHGLSAHAEHWAVHCQQQAALLGVPLQLVRVQVKRQPRQSPEDAARQARYQAFTEHVASGVLLLGHHLDDQAETLLLRIGRGTGPKGLAGMAASRPLRADLQLLRPLLTVARSQLAALASHMGWRHIDDDSNSDLRFRRNALRHQLLPLWAQLQPGIAAQLGRLARHCGELDALASEVAQADLQQCGDHQQLALPALAALSPPRRHNLLRYWLGLAGLNAEQEQLHELWRQMSNARSDSTPLLQLGTFSLRRYRQQLYLLPMQSTPLAAMVPWPCWPQPLLLADGRQLQLRAGGGLRPPHADEPVSVRFALPGSLRCWPAGRSRSRELSKLWQEYGVPPWQRPQLPMLFYGEQLVAAVGYWFEQQALASHVTAGIEVLWLAAETPAAD